MELNDLRIFQAVARQGSVTKAATELNYVQSNVTARIKLLEKGLQTSLFYRHKRGMVLNTEGKQLMVYADEILSKWDEMKHVFRESAEPSGVLEVGIVETINALPGILSSYCGKYPNVELTLRTGVTEQLLQDILELKLDGAFVTGPIKHPLIEQVEVIREKLVIVSKESTFAPEDLTSTPLLVYNQGCGYRRRLESWMKDDGLIPKRVMEFGTFGTIIGSVAAGLGITIIPESSVASLVREGSLFSHRLPELYGEVETVFIRRKDAHLTSTVRSFVEEIEGLVSRA